MARMIPDSDIAALRERMPEVLFALYGIDRLSANFACPNPEHDDSDPSAHYYAETQRVKCFGCGGNWDVFDLTGMAQGIGTFQEKVEAVAALVGYRLDDSAGPAPKRRYTPPKPLFPEPKPLDDSRELIDDIIAAHEALYTRTGDAVRRYLHGRGFDDEDILRNAIGVCRDPRRLGIPTKEPAGTIFAVLPFLDEKAEHCYYATVRPVCDAPKEKEYKPKGITAPLWREWMVIAGLPAVYVVEGIFDAMALEKMTGKPTIALMGTEGRHRLAQVLYRTPADQRPQKVILALDCDDAGRKAATALSADLDKLGIPHAQLPDWPDGAKDANERLMAGRGTEWEMVPAIYYTEQGLIAQMLTREVVHDGRAL